MDLQPNEIAPTPHVNFEKVLEDSVFALQQSLMSKLTFQNEVNEAAGTGQIPYIPIASQENPNRENMPFQLNLSHEGWTGRLLEPVVEIRDDNKDHIPPVPDEVLAEFILATGDEYKGKSRLETLRGLNDRLVAIQNQLNSYETSNDETVNNPIRIFGDDYTAPGL